MTTISERSASRWCLAAAVILLTTTVLAACEVDDNALDPQDGTPAVSEEVAGEKVWRVRWDNPAIGSLYNLPFGEVEGYAIRIGAGWEYNKFDLEIEVNDADGKHRLYTWPVDYGTYGDDDGSFFFNTHGTKLNPMVGSNPASNMTTGRAFHDTWNQPELLYADPLGNTEGRFQLDPIVGLVPLRVIVLDGPGLTTPIFSGGALAPKWFSEKSAKLLFDDRWSGDKGKNNTNPFYPDNVVTVWTHRPGTGQVSSPEFSGGRHMQPDRVLDQCDAQVRMVSYHACTVPADVLYNGECLSSFGQTAHVSSIRNYIAQNCDVPSDIPWVVFAGSLSANSCVSGTLKGGQDEDDVFISNMGASENTLSHELGHLLGLAHLPVSGNPDNLMAPGQGLLLNENQCAKVNERAHSLQESFWKGAQFKGDWKIAKDLAFDKNQDLARDLWRDIGERRLDELAQILGRSNFDRLTRAVWGSPAEWLNEVPNLEVLVANKIERIERILTEEELGRLREILYRR